LKHPEGKKQNKYTWHVRKEEAEHRAKAMPRSSHKYMCLVRGCSSTFDVMDMVRVPTLIGVRRRWSPLIGVHWHDFPVVARVCVKHFNKDEDFVQAERTKPFGSARLKPGVLPSLNLPDERTVDDDYEEVMRYARVVIGDTGFGQDSDDESIELKKNKEDKAYMTSVLMILKDADSKLEKVRKLRAEENLKASKEQEDKINYHHEKKARAYAMGAMKARLMARGKGLDVPGGGGSSQGNQGVMDPPIGEIEKISMGLEDDPPPPPSAAVVASETI